MVQAVATGDVAGMFGLCRTFSEAGQGAKTDAGQQTPAAKELEKAGQEDQTGAGQTAGKIEKAGDIT